MPALDNDPFLANFRIAVSPPFAVCQRCRSAFTLHALLHHLRSVHDCRADVDRFTLALEKRGVRSRFSVSPRPMPCVPGVTIFQGVQCTACDHLFSDPDDFAEHSTALHSRSAETVASRACRLQDVHVSEDSSVLILVLDATGDDPASLSADHKPLVIVQPVVNNAQRNDSRECDPMTQDDNERNGSSSAPQHNISVPSERCCSPILPSATHATLFPSSSTLNRLYSDFSVYSNTDRKYQALLQLLRAIGNNCPLCWFRGEKVSHWAYNCLSGTCRTQKWKEFKRDLRLPHNIVCKFCGVPRDDIFGHPCQMSMARPNCRYGDKLKEVAYLVYVEDESIRKRVFMQLGKTCPQDLGMYANFLEQSSCGCLNFVDLVVAYSNILK